ncbi:hypothetical protein DFH27DRAFT_624001 [Peziza echinospora]|nr:hypothetical protein DFH27DRAFT_624001 [Peziza echinospora]
MVRGQPFIRGQSLRRYLQLTSISQRTNVCDQQPHSKFPRQDSRSTGYIYLASHNEVTERYCTISTLFRENLDLILNIQDTLLPIFSHLEQPHKPLNPTEYTMDISNKTPNVKFKPPITTTNTRDRECKSTTTSLSTETSTSSATLKGAAAKVDIAVEEIDRVVAQISHPHPIKTKTRSQHKLVSASALSSLSSKSQLSQLQTQTLQILKRLLKGQRGLQKQVNDLVVQVGDIQEQFLDMQIQAFGIQGEVRDVQSRVEGVQEMVRGFGEKMEEVGMLVEDIRFQ